MLNSNQMRELAYVVKIDDIQPIQGSDNCECAVVGGWRVMTKKGTFKPGDYAIYFEIDSKCPEKEPFLFLASKHFKVKTQRYTFGGKGNFISQGLLMSISDFTSLVEPPFWALNLADMIDSGEDVEHMGLTENIGVTYAVEEDNKRKASSEDKYKKMAQRKPNIFKKPWAKWLMRRNWGKKIMFFFFGKKKDKKNAWPSWVQKTDEERVQNQAWRFKKGNTEKYIVSEKIDGSSTTATLRKVSKRKYDFFVCSRNVVFDKPDKKCYYDTNIYLEMSQKYHFEEVLKDIVDKYNLKWVTLQGETYGAGVQKRNYGMTDHDFAGFNLIFSDRGRLNSYEARDIMNEYGVPWVPLICDDYTLPETIEEMLQYAEGVSEIDGGMREGIVIRSQDGVDSFKAVSNNYLIKYHS